jgi:DNA-directed RNA polymerase subunit L
MADVNANIGIHIDSSAALAELKALQRQLATFHASIAKNSAAAGAAQKGLQQNLLNAINATGQFHAQMGLVRTSTESFTHALENNKLSMREYFRYAGASSKSFGKLFKEEFNTIGKVAEERVRKMQTQYIKMGRDASGAMKAMSVTPATLNMNDYGNKAAVAAQKQALFNQLVKQGSTSLLNFGKNTQWAGRQLMVGFSVPLMYIGSIASKTFMEMEEQAIRFKRVYGDIFTNAEETEKAIKDIELLAKSFTKYGVAVTDTMKMAADAAAMGKTGAELTAQVSEATRLAVLGGVEQQQSLETTISLTNAFGISADQLASKINFLNAVENQTVVSIEDLTIAIPKAGPVIKQLGGDVEDLAFFLTAMKEGGINASEGANALKSGLASLINPSKKAAAMLMDLGVNINGIVEANAGDVKNTVIGFAQALDTLDPLNRSRAIEQLFGKFQFARLSTLFQNITKDGTQASKVLGLTQASVEELAIMSERELKRVEDAVGVNFKQAVEDLKVSIMPIGKAFLEALTPIVKFAAEILKKFDGLGDGTKKFIVVATTLVGILGPTLLMTFGLVANGAANIIKLFLALRTGFLKLGGNTTVLSQQTSYLNAEQLEAATVAASLNQAHTRLTQSFNLEATAVHALRNAYVQATTAALTFARANPGMMAPGFSGKVPKKFAQGSTYVPGTGTKDTVPSMLTPGEAVIPRDVAQNPAYQPIIDAMVNGKLQGFNTGTTAVVAFGAHQPFTTAHEDIANQGKSIAVAEGSEFIQYTSAGTKAKKGVVSLDTRVRQIEEATGKPPVVTKDPFALMEDLKNRGITDVKILLGSDRMESAVFDQAAEKHGITLQKVEVPRKPGSQDDVSATKLREAVESGDLKTARKLLAKGTSAATKKLIIDEIKDHYKTEKSKVTLFGDEYNTQSAQGKKGLLELVDQFVPTDKKDTYVFTDPKTGEQTTLTREKIVKALKKRSGPGQEFNASTVQKALRIGTGRTGSGVSSLTSGRIADLAREAGYPNKIEEQEAIEKYLKERGIKLDPGQKKSYFQLEKAHIVESKDAEGNKIFRAANIVPDSGWSNNYLNTAKGTIGQALLAMTDDQLKERGTDRASVERLVKGEHPNTAALAKAMRAAAVLDTQKNPTKAMAHAVIAGMDYRFETGFYPAIGSRPTIAELFPDDPTVKAQKAEDAIFEVTDENVKKSRFKDTPVTRYGEKITGTSGWSFKEANHIGGVYKNADGSQVFVKPMMTEDIALAEQRLTEIGRRTGLQTPEQTLRVIQDPRTGKKLFALESPYNPTFDPATIPKTFSEQDYFTQLVAAGVRGDTDLKKGNLGGIVLTDPGRSGVLNKASGTLSPKTGELDRYLSMDIPSLKEIAEKNLSGVTGDYAGNSPRWFGNATADIAKNMTSDVYHEKMIAEINRQEQIVRQALTDFNLNPQERPYYENMLRRLEEGKGVNWRELHKLHTSIVIKPDEEIEKIKTGETRKPQTKSKPGYVKSSSKDPDDTKIAAAPKKGEQVVQGKKSSKPKSSKQKSPRTKLILPGFANAPISQTDALARVAASPSLSSGMLIDEINVDALNKEVNNTTGRFKDLANKSNIAAGAISGLTMMAAFSGGKLGEVATAAMPFVFGIQGVVALLPMMKNPWVAAVAAIAALGIGIMTVVANAKKMAQKEADYIDSVSATTNKMKKIGEITDKIGASEIMAKRRADYLPSFGDKPVTREGQQFGTNFMGSEIGKEISKGFSDSLLTDRSTAVKQFALQLSNYVSDGVIDGVQAGDIARQVAIDFQDMSLYPSILGQLTSIIGPDGVDILKDPIKVRLEIINQGADAAALAADQIVPNLPDTTAPQRVGRLFNPKAAFNFVKDYFVGSDKTNKAAAASSALSNQALSSAKAQADATQVQYEKDLKVLQAKKAIAKTEKERKVAQDAIDTLTSTNKDNTISLRKEVERLLKAQQDAFNKTSKKAQGLTYGDPNPAQKAFIEAGRQQVVTKYKDGGLVDSANAMLANTKNLKSTSLEVRINALAATGTNPTNLSALMKMFSGEGGEAALKKELDLAVKTRDIDKTIGLVGQLLFLKDEDLKKELFVGINAIEDEDTYLGILKTITELQEMDGKDFNVNAILETEGVPGLIKLQKELRKLEKLPDPITKFTQIKNSGLPAGAIDAISAEWEYFMSLPPEVRKRAITTKVTAYETIGQEQIDAQVSKMLKGRTGEDLAKAKKFYASEAGINKVKADLSQQAVTPRYKPGMDLPKTPDDLDTDNTNTNTETRDTTLDDLFKQLRFVRDAAIKAKGDVADLAKLTAGKGITKFTGLSQQLMAGPKGGFNRDFITMLGGMDDAMLATYVDAKKLKKGIVELLQPGRDLKEILNARDIGLYHDAQVKVVQDSIAQDAAFKKLRKAGIDVATALEMTADAGVAVNINSKEVDDAKMLEMAAATKAAKDETLGLDRALISVISNSQKELDKANEDLNALTEARNRFNYSAEDLKIIGDDPTLLNALKKMLDSNTTKPEVAKLKKDIESGLSNIKTTVKVKANISDLKRSIEEIASSVQSIFDRAMSNMQKVIEATEAGIAIKWDPIIAEADKAVADIQGTIDDTVTVDSTGKITGVVKGLQTKFDEASDAVNKATDTYDKSIQGINDTFELETADFTKKIKELNGEIKKIQDAKDINMMSKLSIASAFGENQGGIDLNLASLAEAEKFIADTQNKIQEQFTRKIELAQQDIALWTRAVEMQYTRAIEDIQKKIEGIQRNIALNFDIPLKNMQDESSKLSEDLAVMDKITESINDKYKVQEDALTKVAELNQDIVEQQKQQLGLADALSKGDISAAAAAVQDMRATEAAKALGSQQGTLGKAKEAELAAVKSSSGLTRDQIAERQYAIERASYQIQLQRAALEKQIADEQERIYSIENSTGRLEYIKAIKDEEDKIYGLELSRQNVNNALYIIQTQIEAKNDKIALQQAAITAEEDKIKEKQDARETALKAAEAKHKEAMVGLNKALTDAEDNLKNAQTALAKAQAEADALRKAKDKEIEAATAAMKAEFAAIETGLKNATAAAISFKEQLILAQGAAKTLGDLYANAIKLQTEADAKKLAADQKELADRKTAEKTAAKAQADADAKAATDAETKAKAAEEELANFESMYSDTFEMTKQQIEDLNRITKIAKESRAEANRLAKIAEASKAAELVLNPVAPPVAPMTPEELAARIAKWRKNNTWGVGIPDIAVPNQPGFSLGGMVPKYFASGGFSKGTDTIPAMLTPGEFVIKKSAVDSYGVKNLSKINNGMSPDSSVYNYSLSVNVSGNNLNADDIASTVMQKIKYIDGQRVRGQR